MALVKIVVTVHNIKDSFLKMLKMYLQLRNALIKFLNIKSVVSLKMETKKIDKKWASKKFDKVTKSYLLTNKTHEDLL